MNKFISSVLVILVLAVGGLYLKDSKPAPATPQEGMVGASGTMHFQTEYFTSLGHIGSLSTSSSSPASYGSASSFQMVVPAASTIGRASTSAVTSLSNRVYVQQTRTTAIPGTTCNTSTIATGTAVSLTAVPANPSMNGVTITVPASPVTNPYCFDVTIFQP